MTIWILGATSGIGEALVKKYRAENHNVIATGRRVENLKKISSETGCSYKDFDLTTSGLTEILDSMPFPDLMIFNAGFGHRTDEPDDSITQTAIDLNVSAFNRVANYALRKNIKTFAAVASIAGIRGLENTNGYSASKAYIINSMEGFRRKINKENRRQKFITLLPGFVDTAMGQASKFWRVSADTAADSIVKAIEKEKDVAYVTPRWFLVAILLKLLPRKLFERI